MLTGMIKYLISLAKPETVSIREQLYITGKIEPVIPPGPTQLVIHTLTGLVDYINSDEILIESFPIIQVEDFDSVSFRSQLIKTEHNRRETYIHATAIPMFTTAEKLVGRTIEDMIVLLGTSFAPSDDRERVIKLLGNITKTTDDGITQQVNIKKGISLQGVAEMPNVIELLPWRSFPEIDPRPSKWLIRMKSDEHSGLPIVSLHEVNREQWRSATIEAIAVYLGGQMNSSLHDIVIIA